MRISSIISNYTQNITKFSAPKISFGELDGDFYDYVPCKMSKEQYAIKKMSINEKYDNMKSSWLSDCDDLEISNSAAWNRLKQIEQQRSRDLAILEQEYYR